MAVTSTTIAGVNCWQFSGAVTQSEITTAWAALITNGEYVPGRALYFDNTCDLTAVQGGFSVNMTIGSNAFILHTGRDKTKTVLRYWNVRLTTGLAVTSRSTRVALWDGTNLTYPTNSTTSDDGLGLYGGSLTYAVTGNPGGADPRYLDEMALGLLGGGVQIASAAYTEQELQPDVRGTKELSDVAFTRCFGFPQASGPFSRQIMWRCYENTMSAAQRPIRVFLGASQCFVGSTVRRNGAAVTTNLVDAYGSSSGTPTNLLIANNWQDESWFGASKTTIPVSSWVAQNTFFGCVFRKLEFTGVGTSGTVKVYDSRSTTAPQRSTFVGTATADFIAAGTGTATDSNGRVWIAIMGGAIDSAGTITRYTNQRYTFQAFGYRVTVSPAVTMTTGDDNNSPYAPVVPVAQAGISRTQAAITAATTIANFQQLLEEVHVLAIGLSGSGSYAGTYSGNLFDYNGTTLTTSFASVVVDATAASKISYNSATNVLTVKASTLAANTAVSTWVNSSGAITTANGATITGTYTDSTGTRVNITELTGRAISTYVTINGTAVGGSTVNSVFIAGWVANTVSRTITVQPTDNVRIVAGYWGSKALLVNCLGSEIAKFTLTLETDPSVDTTISTTNRDAIANSFLTIVNGTTGNIEGTINQTLAAYTPNEVISAIAYDIVTSSYQVFAACAAANTVAFYGISAGKLVFYSPSYKLRMADTAVGGATITPNATGYSIPIVTYYYNVATGVASPVTLLNASGAKLETAPWTQATVSLSDSDKAAIAAASSASVWAAATRTLTASLDPTAAQVATAVRTELATELARVDVAVSTRLASAAYTAPSNADISAIKAKTDNLPLQPAAVGSAMTLTSAYDAAKTALPASSYVAPPSAAQVATAVMDSQVETGATLAQSLRLSNSVLGGKVSGAGSGVEKFRNLSDTKDRIVSTVDSDGNRKTVVSDLT